MKQTAAESFSLPKKVPWETIGPSQTTLTLPLSFLDHTVHQPFLLENVHGKRFFFKQIWMIFLFVWPTCKLGGGGGKTKIIQICKTFLFLNKNLSSNNKGSASYTHTFDCHEAAFVVNWCYINILIWCQQQQNVSGNHRLGTVVKSWWNISVSSVTRQLGLCN